MSLFGEFVSNIGKTSADAALDGLAQGVRENEMRNRYNAFYESDNIGIFNPETFNKSNVNKSNILFDDALLERATEVSFAKPTNDKVLGNNHYKFNSSVIELNKEAEDDTTEYADNLGDFGNSDIYKLRLPSWGYSDFINERNIFLKHLSNGFDIPNWLYFKIFFEFDTNHGLFGGIMNNGGLGTNCAYNYLNLCSKRYKQEKIQDRILSLVSFVRLLSFINIYAPWFFKNIKNLSEISNPIIQNIGEEKYIEIELDKDAIDMRITTLLSLYKYACYDDMNQKEIIPDNLRKFNLCLVLFSSPLNNIHNIPINNNVNNPELKRINSNKNSFKHNFDDNLNITASNDTYNQMSFKLYKFINCEIDPITIGGYVPVDITNDNPFQLGGNTIKIKYDRVYEYNMNEFMGVMIGSDGIYVNSDVTVNDLHDNNIESISNSFIHNKISSLLGNNINYALGNIYGQDKALYKENINGLSIDKVNTGTKYFTDYAKAKFNIMQKNKNSIIDIGFDKLYQLLGTSYKSGTSPGIYGDGTVLNGHGKYGIGSAIWNSKVERQVKGGGLSVREKRVQSINNFENFDLMKYIRDKSLKRGY